MPSSNRQKKALSKGSKNPIWSFRRRSAILVTLFLVLLAFFFYMGGIAGFANSMSENAILARQFDQAEKWLACSRWVSANNPKMEFLSAKLARVRGDFQLMSVHLKSALDHGHDPRVLEREQALALASRGQFDRGAEQRIRAWIEEKPADLSEIVDAYTNGLLSLGRIKEAGIILEAYESEFPQDPLPNYRFGMINEHLNDTVKAEEEYRKALEKDPKHIRAIACLSGVLTEKKNTDEAIRLLESINYGEQKLVVQSAIAKLRQTLGDIDISRDMFKEILKAGKEKIDQSSRVLGSVQVRFGVAAELGVLELEAGNYEDAKKYLEMALDAYANDFTAGYSYALVLGKLGMTKEADEYRARIEKAQKALDRVNPLKIRLSRSESDVEARIEIGKIVMEYESVSGGIFWITSALAYDPGNIEAHQILVDYFEGKRSESAAFGRQADYHRSFIKK